MSKKIVVLVIFLIGAVFLGIKGRSILKERQKAIEEAKTPSMQIVSVALATPKIGELQAKNRYLATLKSNKSIKLSTKLAGFIKKIYVKESQSVKKGELLVTIDAKEILNTIESIKANINALKSELEVAKKIYKTNWLLYKAGGLPKEKLEASAAALKLKEARINESLQKINSLKNQLSYLNIKAPFDGKIDNILLHEGDLAAARIPIIIMSENRQKLIFSFVSSDNIKINLPISFNKEIVGRVSTIYTSAKNALQIAEVKLTKPINLPLESLINIEVIIKSAKGCIVPNNAILHNKDGNFVMVYKDKKFSPFRVEILVESDNRVLISPCLKDKVAVGSEQKLSSLTTLGEVNILGDSNE